MASSSACQTPGGYSILPRCYYLFISDINNGSQRPLGSLHRTFRESGMGWDSTSFFQNLEFGRGELTFLKTRTCFSDSRLLMTFNMGGWNSRDCLFNCTHLRWAQIWYETSVKKSADRKLMTSGDRKREKSNIAGHYRTLSYNVDADIKVSRRVRYQHKWVKVVLFECSVFRTCSASFNHLRCWRQQTGNGLPEGFPLRRLFYQWSLLLWFARRFRCGSKPQEYSATVLGVADVFSRWIVFDRGWLSRFRPSNTGTGQKGHFRSAAVPLGKLGID